MKTPNAAGQGLLALGQVPSSDLDITHPRVMKDVKLGF
jgi:hypothetical protein